MSLRRKVESTDLTYGLLDALKQIYCQPDPKVIKMIQAHARRETSPLAKDMLKSIVANAEIAAREEIPTCQDTGTVLLFLEVGERFGLIYTDIKSAVDKALEIGWRRYFLRRSMVEEPLFDRNFAPEKVPAVIHWEMNPGNQLKVTLGLKGGGAENMSLLKMMPATSSPEVIKETVVDAVVKAGGKPCPPVIVGVGLGGNFESCAILAKKALFEDLGRPHPDPRYAALEQDILAEINRWGRGVMGIGEGPTALAVHIKSAPCHIASLPLAVNMDCHAHRHTSFTI